MKVESLNGVPWDVFRHAGKYLVALEARRYSNDDSTQTTLGFTHMDEEPALTAEQQALLDALAAIEPDNLSPRDALDKLYALKALMND